MAGRVIVLQVIAHACTVVMITLEVYSGLNIPTHFLYTSVKEREGHYL